MENKKNILVVAAHPDDEVLGCGATIAKYAETSDVYVLILGEGITSRYKNRQEAPKEELSALKEKAKKAGEILGAKEVFLLDMPDQRFETVPLLEITKEIEKIIEEKSPQIIFTHSASDLNLDHRITFDAVLTATRPTGACPVKEIYSFESMSSTGWGFGKVRGQFMPNVYEDVSLTLDKKIEALKAYGAEIKEFPHPRSLEGIKILAQKRGMETGFKAAEAFELIRLSR